MDDLKCNIQDVINKVLDCNIHIHGQYRFIQHIYNQVCECGNIDDLELFNIYNIDKDEGLYFACRGNNTNIIQKLRKKVNIRGLQGACEGNHVKLVKDFITLTPVTDSILKYVAKSGNKSMWNLIYMNIQTKFGKVNSLSGLNGACSIDNNVMLNFIMNTYNFTLLNLSFLYLGRGGNIKLIFQTINEYSKHNKWINYNAMINGACGQSHVYVVQEILKLCPNIDYTNAFYASCGGGNEQLVNLFKSKLVKDGIFDKKKIYIGITYACSGGHMDIVNLLNN